MFAAEVDGSATAGKLMLNGVAEKLTRRSEKVIECKLPQAIRG
ncbi:hypothetical protein [Bradyrhizobium sp.]|nr:hypothetical protein [Bradyrhizobium sp.]